MEYMEVTSSRYIDSLVIKLSSNYYSFWGNKNPDGKNFKTTRWEFDEEWQLIGLSGTVTRTGILSISPLTYSMQCAAASLDIEIVPLSDEYNGNPANMLNVDNSNGTVSARRHSSTDEGTDFWDFL